MDDTSSAYRILGTQKWKYNINRTEKRETARVDTVNIERYKYKQHQQNILSNISTSEKNGKKIIKSCLLIRRENLDIKRLFLKKTRRYKTFSCLALTAHMCRSWV